MLTVVEFTMMPFPATGTSTFNSPVLGLYKYFALLVKIVDGVPVVALANNGNRSVAVLVSLLTAAPPVPVDTAVIKPLAFTVTLAVVNEPTLLLTVAAGQRWLIL